LGIARREAFLDWPCGADAYGYAIRDKTGELIHNSIRKTFGSSFGSGDVIGCLIHLPSIKPLKEALKMSILGSYFDTSLYRDRVAIKFKGNIFFESKDYSLVTEQDIEEGYNALQSTDYKFAAKQRTIRTKTGGQAAQRSKSAASILKMTKKTETDYRLVHRTIGKIWQMNENGIPVIPFSKLMFFKNGNFLGDGFLDLPVPLAAAALLPPERRKPREAYMPMPPVEDDGTLG
jgi:hypothetical protein